jgi:hypothetical protein
MLGTDCQVVDEEGVIEIPYVLRVVTARDYDEFVESFLGRPGDGSRASVNWDRVQAVARSGGKQNAENRAQRTKASDPSTVANVAEASDQDPKP